MKILMLTNTYFPIIGGIEQSIHSFAEEFRKQGHQVLIAAPESDRPVTYEEGVVRVPALQIPQTEFALNYPRPGFFEGLISNFSPDILHSHHPFLMGDHALRLSKQFHIPLVLTYHTMFEHYVNSDPLRNSVARRFIIELATGYANMVHQVIAPSASVRDILLERQVTVPIEVIPTGIDLERFAAGQGVAFRRRLGIPECASLVGYIGRLSPEKNLEFLIKSFISFLKEDASGHILIVGQGPLEQKVKNMLAMAEVSHRAHILHFLQGQDLADAYSSLDVFAFASLSETQGLVIIEAMAAGRPVVGVSAPGVRDVVLNKVNGRLLEGLDERQFVSAVLSIINSSPEALLEMKRQALGTARQYSISLSAERALLLYNKLISRQRLLFEEGAGVFGMLRERVKVEQDILGNLVEAAGAAILHGGH